MLNIAIITRKAFKESYQVQRLLEEFRKLNTNPKHISLDNIIVEIDNQAHMYYYDETYKRNININHFNGFFFREVFAQMKDATTIAKWLKKQGYAVIDNNLTNVQYLNNKLQEAIELADASIPFIPTLFFATKQMLLNNIQILEEKLEGYPIIAKKRASGKGIGILKINSRQELLDFAQQVTAKHRLGENAIKLYIFQKFIKVKSEYRVFVINNQVIGAMQRIPKAGNFRANYSQGGTVKKAQVTPSMEALSIKATQATQAIIAGVDYAITEDNKEYIFEVNRTPGFKGFEEATGINIAKELALFVIASIQGMQTHKL